MTQLRFDANRLFFGGREITMWSSGQDMPAHYYPIRLAALSPNGKVVVSADANNVRVWDVQFSPEIKFNASLDNVVAIGINNDRERVAYASNGVLVLARFHKGHWGDRDFIDPKFSIPLPKSFGIPTGIVYGDDIIAEDKPRTDNIILANGEGKKLRLSVTLEEVQE